MVEEEKGVGVVAWIVLSGGFRIFRAFFFFRNKFFYGLRYFFRGWSVLEGFFGVNCLWRE